MTDVLALIEQIFEGRHGCYAKCRILDLELHSRFKDVTFSITTNDGSRPAWQEPYSPKVRAHVVLSDIISVERLNGVKYRAMKVAFYKPLEAWSQLQETG